MEPLASAVDHRHPSAWRGAGAPGKKSGCGGFRRRAAQVLDDLVKRGLRRPELLIVDGGAGLESAIAAVWDRVPVQRCTVHKHRNLLAHAPERLHDEISADYKDMIYADTREEIETRRKAFIRKWRLKHRAVADSLEEAGDRLFTFTRLPPDLAACGPRTLSNGYTRMDAYESSLYR